MAIGDMPNRKNVKWGSMQAGESSHSDEWHGMEPSPVHSTEKWVGQEPSKGHMSDRWVEIDTEADANPQWNEMKQEKRDDPYAMRPSEGDRTVGMKPMAKIKPDNKVGRATQHTEFGSTREI